MIRARLSRIFWIGAAAILVAAALIAITAVVGGGFSDTDGRILATLGVLLLAGATAFAGLSLVERGDARELGQITIAVAAVGFTVDFVAIWAESESLGRVAGTASVAMFALLLGTTSRLRVHDERFVPLWFGTLAALTVAAFLTGVAIWSGDAGSDLGKAIAAFWILGVLGWFLVPVLQRLAGTAGDTTSEPAPERTIATLDGVDVLVTAKPAEGDVWIDGKAATPGEFLVLRRRPA
jgi:uncharacterized membrane protein YvlD (DUF360 family)